MPPTGPLDAFDLTDAELEAIDDDAEGDEPDATVTADAWAAELEEEMT